MAGKGNQIIVSSNPQGVFLEGLLTGTPKPGQIMQIDVSEGINSDEQLTFEPYAPGTDGNQRPIFVLLENSLVGGLMTTAYATGDHVQVYVPRAGEELNVLLQGGESGTDAVSFGDLLIIDTGTGEVIPTTGSPESEPFIVLEAITEPAADVLCHVMYTGY